MLIILCIVVYAPYELMLPAEAIIIERQLGRIQILGL